ncbi:MAG TPA: Wzy polymerase domain-containing protein, partial [Stellaceae bacterium]|nr:Wzy polymerase domain-containing protein [Stellaceae bacterium]
PARWLIAFAIFLGCMAALGSPAYPQLLWVAALYVVYAALMLWLGAQLTGTLGLERVAVTLAACLLVGALLTALSGVVQFYGRPRLLEDFVAELYGTRAYGNIGQANLYANYLVLGEGSLAYLWARSRVRTPHMLAALALLLWGLALAGSRSALLYVLWLAVLATLTARGDENRRLRGFLYAAACATLLADVMVPWLNSLLHLGPASEGALERVLVDEAAEPRPLLWLLGLRVFAGAPVLGVGIGEFARAAFDSGLDPALLHRGELWTSPHNLVLQLLAETGLVGAALALAGLGAWGLQAARGFRESRDLARWWLVATVGVELIHSMIEFPLWYAHYLAVTALLMGAGTTPDPRSPAMSRPGRIATGTTCAVLAFASIVLLRDYLRLDSARVTGAAVTLARAADAQRDAATMRELTRGLMAPLAEYWLVIGAPLDRSDLAGKLAMSERVARFWPTYDVLARHAVFLALSGQAGGALELLARLLQTLPHRRVQIVAILAQARGADPAAIDPLLRLAEGDSRENRD